MHLLSHRIAGLVDSATLYHTGGHLTTFALPPEATAPRIIAHRSDATGGELLVAPAAYRAFRALRYINDHAAGADDVFPHPKRPKASGVASPQNGAATGGSSGTSSCSSGFAARANGGNGDACGEGADGGAPRASAPQFCPRSYSTGDSLLPACLCASAARGGLAPRPAAPLAPLSRRWSCGVAEVASALGVLGDECPKADPAVAGDIAMVCAVFQAAFREEQHGEARTEQRSRF